MLETHSVPLNLQKTLTDMKEADDAHGHGHGRSTVMQILENVYRFGLGAIAGGSCLLGY